MIELPEALCLSSQLNEHTRRKVVARVLPPSKPHKFCWFSGDPADYESRLKNLPVTGAEGFGAFAEMRFGDKERLSINDGVNPRLINGGAIPKAYQLLIEFTDGCMLAFSVAMYGGIQLHDDVFGNEYYLKSRDAKSPLTGDFKTEYERVLSACKPSVSAKAFLATEQRFPGIGNGVLQDILFAAKIHPKRRIWSLSDAEHEALISSVVYVLGDMLERGGRDTEKNIFGEAGGYKTIMSKNRLEKGCPICGGAITKETYMGGSVYYCPNCQPLKK